MSKSERELKNERERERERWRSAEEFFIHNISTKIICSHVYSHCTVQTQSFAFDCMIRIYHSSLFAVLTLKKLYEFHLLYFIPHSAAAHTHTQKTFGVIFGENIFFLQSSVKIL